RLAEEEVRGAVGKSPGGHLEVEPERGLGGDDRARQAARPDLEMRTVGGDREIGFGWRRHGHSRRRGTPGIARRAGAGYRTFPKTTPAFRRLVLALALARDHRRTVAGVAVARLFALLVLADVEREEAARRAIADLGGGLFMARRRIRISRRRLRLRPRRARLLRLRVPVCRRSRCRALARTRCGRAADRAARRSVVGLRHRPAGRTCARRARRQPRIGDWRG